MNARRSAVLWIRLALAALAVGLFARYLANVDGPVTTRAQSPHPTSTWTPTPEGQTTPTKTPTPVPPTNTPTPVPPTNTPTPVPPTNTPTPVPPTNTPLPPTPTDTPLPPTPTDTPVPLDCSHAEPSVATLWPPDHRFVAVSVLGVQPEVTVVIDSIFQDEPVHTPGSGSTSPDGQGVGTTTAWVRAERAGGGNGRVYLIAFTASDGHGGTCSGEVRVAVPQSDSHAAVDDGPLVDSTDVTP